MTTGLVLGKFMPPHRGHVYLCEFARAWVDDLAIVVESVRGEPIPSDLRHRWMTELFPFDRVLHLTGHHPQDPAETPDFWAIWRASLLSLLGSPPDLVFASEPYGAPLADVLGARFVPVDVERSVVPVSGTAIRAQPLRHWHHLPRCVRPHFARRVSVFGPESTGKTTLARTLAEAFDTVRVPERARTVLEPRGGSLDGLDWTGIVRGQIASEEALARDANRVLICDTDPLLTTVWARRLLGECPADVRAAAAGRRYDLTLLTDADVPWVSDPVRYLPGEGREFGRLCAEALDAAGRRTVVLRGSWDERTKAAVDAVAGLLEDADEADLSAWP